MLDETSERVHVDRTEQLTLFTDMISGQGKDHVFLICAHGGMGKTTLLEEFQDLSAALPRITIDLKGRRHSVEDLLGALAGQQYESFGGYRERQLELSMPSGTYISNSKIQQSSISVHQAGAAAPREARRQILTDAFFSDLLALAALPGPVVLTFDTYNDATREVRDWLAGLFLPRVSRHREIVVVVAGRTVPEPSLSKRGWCVEHSLSPLAPEHVAEYVRRKNFVLSTEQAARLHEETSGVPLALKTMVNRFMYIFGESR